MSTPRRACSQPPPRREEVRSRATCGLRRGGPVGPSDREGETFSPSPSSPPLEQWSYFACCRHGPAVVRRHFLRLLGIAGLSTALFAAVDRWGYRGCWRRLAHWNWGPTVYSSHARDRHPNPMAAAVALDFSLDRDARYGDPRACRRTETVRPSVPGSMCSALPRAGPLVRGGFGRHVVVGPAGRPSGGRHPHRSVSRRLRFYIRCQIARTGSTCPRTWR